VLGKSIFTGFLVTLAAASASAGVVTDVIVSPGTELAVPFINKFSVSNFDMSGMKVTAYFDDAVDFSETGTWNGASGQATGANFRLSETGDTFENAWTLVNLSPSALLTRLVIEGTPGFTVFDLQGPTFRTTAGSVLPSGNSDATEGTIESERGYTFLWDNVNDGNFTPVQPDFNPILAVTATYSNIVRLTSAAGPVGDVWTTLTLDFGGDAGGLIGPDFFGQLRPFIFFADTDTWGDRTVTDNVAPEPSSFCLLAGFGLLAAWRYRRAARLLPRQS
jgi:hypothetical protein